MKFLKSFLETLKSLSLLQKLKHGGIVAALLLNAYFLSFHSVRTFSDEIGNIRYLPVPFAAILIVVAVLSVAYYRRVKEYKRLIEIRGIYSLKVLKKGYYFHDWIHQIAHSVRDMVFVLHGATNTSMKEERMNELYRKNISEVIDRVKDCFSLHVKGTIKARLYITYFDTSDEVFKFYRHNSSNGIMDSGRKIIPYDIEYNTEVNHCHTSKEKGECCVFLGNDILKDIEDSNYMCFEIKEAMEGHEEDVNVHRKAAPYRSIMAFPIRRPIWEEEKPPRDGRKYEVVGVLVITCNKREVFSKKLINLGLFAADSIYNAVNLYISAQDEKNT